MVLVRKGRFLALAGVFGSLEVHVDRVANRTVAENRVTVKWRMRIVVGWHVTLQLARGT
jgi:hypothetical protein